jgi:hypothetical protein
MRNGARGCLRRRAAQTAEVALLAQIGSTQPLVSRPVRVLHITTGNELVDPAQFPRAGTDSRLEFCAHRRPALRARRNRRAPDTQRRFARGARGRDRDSGRSRVGFGCLSQAAPAVEIRLRQAGRWAGLALRFVSTRSICVPGMPLVFATRGRQAAFRHSRNPVSHLVHVSRPPLPARSGASRAAPTSGRSSAPRSAASAGGSPRDVVAARLTPAGAEPLACAEFSAISWESRG